MEQNRKPISPMDLKGIITNLRRTEKYSEEMLQLISDDLIFGLSKEETERYIRKNLDIRQMRVFSKCLRNGYSEEDFSVITADGLNGLQMEVALEFYERGVPIETIKQVYDRNGTPAVMKLAYQTILDELKNVKEKSLEVPESMESLIEEIKAAVSKIEYQEKRYDVLNEKLKMMESAKHDEEIKENLIKSLTEKDQLLSEQQDRVNQANATIARLRSEKEEKDKEMRSIQEKMEKLEEELNKKDEMSRKEELSRKEERNKKADITDNQNSTVYSIPVHYNIPVRDEKGNSTATVLVEKSEKKTNALLSLITKVAFKKKSRQDIVKMVVAGELYTEQLVQIRIGIEKRLTEQQLLELIRNKVPAEQMKEIIEIAVLENSMQY